MPESLAKSTPLRAGVILFPGFQALDVFGPLDCLNVLSRNHDMTLAIISSTLEPVSTESPGFPNAISQSVVPTHTFATAPALDLLLVPGGLGTRSTNPVIEEAISFIRDVYPQLSHLITVCTGSGLAARAGVLDGKRATSNKLVWAEITAMSTSVDWVPHARWVVDGNVWTSSGVSAGIDVTLAWIEKTFGSEEASRIANRIEYIRHEDPSDDPFAKMYGL